MSERCDIDKNGSNIQNTGACRRKEGFGTKRRCVFLSFVQVIITQHLQRIYGCACALITQC